MQCSDRICPHGMPLSLFSSSPVPYSQVSQVLLPLLQNSFQHLIRRQTQTSPTAHARALVHRWQHAQLLPMQCSDLICPHGMPFSLFCSSPVSYSQVSQALLPLQHTPAQWLQACTHCCQCNMSRMLSPRARHMTCQLVSPILAQDGICPEPGAHARTPTHCWQHVKLLVIQGSLSWPLGLLPRGSKALHPHLHTPTLQGTLGRPSLVKWACWKRPGLPEKVCRTAQATSLP